MSVFVDDKGFEHLIQTNFPNLGGSGEISADDIKQLMDGMLNAADSAKLGGKLPSEYATAAQGAKADTALQSFTETDPTVGYGVSAEAANAVTKTVTITDFKLKTGAQIAVRFTNGNSNASATLNVNSTGAYPIHYSTGASSTDVPVLAQLPAGHLADLVFDGAKWMMINPVIKPTLKAEDVGAEKRLLRNFGYGTCNTGMNITIKVVSVPNFNITVGSVVGVYFSAGINTIASPTLLVNGNATSPIQWKGASLPVAGYIGQGLHYFWWDGTSWQLLNPATGTDANDLIATSTSSGTALNVVASTPSTSPNFIRTNPSCIIVRFSNNIANPNITLNIDSTGAAPIKINGEIITGDILANKDHIFYWDGASYNLVNPARLINIEQSIAGYSATGTLTLRLVNGVPTWQV